MNGTGHPRLVIKVNYLMCNSRLHVGLKGVAVSLLFILSCAGAIAADASAPQNTPESVEPDNALCLGCHSDETLQYLSGDDLAKMRRVVLSQPAFSASVHGQLTCTTCHSQGFTEQPHTAGAKKLIASCPDCHADKVEKIGPEFEKSVHAKNLTDKMTCLTCHNPHVMQIAKNLKQPSKIVAQDNRVCLGCHDSDTVFAKYAPEKKARPLIDDIHSWLPNTRMHWKAVRCVECHTPLNQDMQSHEIHNKAKAVKKCVTCHSANSALIARLYRHMVREDHQKYGFLNSAILGNAYVIGATRNPTLDTLVISLVALTVIGVLIHGLLRYIASRLRRRKSHV